MREEYIGVLAELPVTGLTVWVVGACFSLSQAVTVFASSPILHL